ncbi:MAG: hypothetical protein RLP15_00405 [Cryomorphaceae bacterium]
MLIYTTCSKCNAAIRHRTYSNTRVELAMKEGEQIHAKCTACNHHGNYAVDEWRARSSKMAAIVSLLVLIVGTGAMIYVLFFWLNDVSTSVSVFAVSGLLVAPAAAYGILQKQENDRVSHFNRHHLKR